MLSATVPSNMKFSWVTITTCAAQVASRQVAQVDAVERHPPDVGS